MTTGYTDFVLIGGKSDAGGSWQWEDGSFFDAAFITSHSWDSLLDPQGGASRSPAPLMLATPAPVFARVLAASWALGEGGGLTHRACGAGTSEDQLALYPPVCNSDWVQAGGRKDGQVLTRPVAFLAHDHSPSSSSPRVITHHSAPLITTQHLGVTHLSLCLTGLRRHRGGRPAQ
jgi:hypothetical protein